MISNIIINPSWKVESLEMETPGFWFLIMHVVIAYIILTRFISDKFCRFHMLKITL
jgi:hypothetical protein